MMGYIDADGYHKGRPPTRIYSRQNSTFRDHDHNRQRHDYSRELIQPYNRNGKPNDKFIEAWPEESKGYGFLPTDEELQHGTDKK